MNIVALGLDFKGRQLFKPMTEADFAKSLVNAIEGNIETVRDLAKATTEVGSFRGEVTRLAIDPGDPNGLGVVSLSTLLSVDQAGLLAVRGKTLSDPVRRFVSVMEETIDANHKRP